MSIIIFNYYLFTYSKLFYCLFFIIIIIINNYSAVKINWFGLFLKFKPTPASFLY